MIRLNKYLAQSGVASRRKCDELIAQGKIYVNGKVATVGTQVDEKKDKVVYEGNQLKVNDSFVYLKMHKPKGYVCSANDEHGRKTVYDLLPKLEARVFTIGRLDYDTEGLLLFTNDGEMAQKLSHPRNEVKKIYVAKVSGKMKESELAVLRKGVVLENEVLPDAKVEYFEIGKDYTKLQITLDEGKNHQIKNMFDAIGKELLFLKRIQVGEIKLGGLSRGETRELTEEEKNSLILL